MAAAAGQRGKSLRELRASEKAEMGQRRGLVADRRHGSAAWGLGRLGSLMKWVNWWVGDVELRCVGDVKDRVRSAAVRQRGVSLRE